MTASTLLGMLLPATLASCASALALVLSSGAPARWRLAIASSGLLAWLIPWPLLVLPMTSPQAAIAADWGGNFAEELVVGPVHPTTSVASAGHADGSTRALAWLPVALPAMALLPGLLMLLADIVRYRRTL